MELQYPRYQVLYSYIPTGFGDHSLIFFTNLQEMHSPFMQIYVYGDDSAATI